MRHSDPGSRLISAFSNAFQQTPSGTTTVEAFLHGVQSGHWRREVETVRALTDPDQIKEAKKRVPAVAPSALFDGKRGKEYVQQHSGFLNLDLDNKENPGIADRASRARVYADQYVFAGHVSVSGHGLSLYVQIDPAQHEAAFLQLEAYFFAAWGVHVDPACKDVSRLRFVSYDPALYRNTEARPFITRKKRFSQAQRPARRSVDRPAVQDSDQYFEAVLSQILAAGYDLTGTYYDWVKIGFALAEGYNEAGRQYFHEISQFHPKYKPAETDQQFTRCLQTRAAGVTISTFFYMAKQAGFTFK
ncbi:MAG: PriCT-2 domain-containing protein [Chlorobiales bacterium]|nr:PriCT-2 domain-containing protein [Chlorobiales bacterium]